MKETPEPRRDRVSIEAAQHDVYKKLAGSEKSVFKTMKDLFLAAACIGYQLNRRERLNRKQQIFSSTIFSPQDDIPIIRALAIADTGDVKVLLDQNEVLTIAEEYANAGIAIIERRLVHEPGDSMLKLAEMVTTAINEVAK